MKHTSNVLCIGIALFFVLSTTISVHGDPNNCSARLSGCIESYSQQTLTVTKNVNTLISQFNVCNRFLTVDKKLDGTGPLVPSVMFLIDNSNSMNGLDNANNPCDTAGRRFKMVSRLIDSIYSKFPAAEVGISVFVENLFYDTNDQYVIPLPYATFPPEQPKSQGYLPMRRLDSLVADGVRWVDVLKQHLETKDSLVKNNNYSSPVRTSLLKSEPSFSYGGYTNCNVAFETARIEFAKTRNIKDNHFVLFISDGEPNRAWPNNSNNYFVQGILIPSIYTVYLTHPDINSQVTSEVPSVFISMTQNIKSNKYSISNNRSQYILMHSSVDTMVDKVNRFICPHAASEQIMLNLDPLVKVNGELCSGDYTNGIFKLTYNFELSDSLNFFTMQKEFKTSAIGFPEIHDTVLTTNFIIEKRENAVVSSGVTIDCNTGNTQTKGCASLQNTVSYNCRGNFLNFRGLKIYTIDIVSLSGKEITHVSGNGSNFVSIDTRSISDIKAGYYCAKVKSQNGISTFVISIGINVK